MSPRELLDRLGIEYVERTTRLMMRCVFHHDRSPSSGFYFDTEKFFCFSCELSLDIPGFYAKYREITRAQALMDLGYTGDLEPKYDKRWADQTRVRAENALARKNTTNRVEHALLAERLDKILWLYSRNQLKDDQFEKAMILWYTKLYGEKPRQGDPATNRPDDRLQKRTWGIPEPRSQRAGEGLALLPIEDTGSVRIRVDKRRDPLPTVRAENPDESGEPPWDQRSNSEGSDKGDLA